MMGAGRSDAALGRALASIASELCEEGSVFSDHVVVDPGHHGGLGDLVAAGPRNDADAYACVIELVREGYLLHYRTSRLISGADPDLALLAGDYLYAKGLRQLAMLGDLAAVSELAELIATSARLDATGAPEDAVAVVWLASALAIATGEAGTGRADARAALEAGDPSALFAWTAAAADEAGLGDRLRGAADSVGFRAFDRG